MSIRASTFSFVFFFNDTATTEIYTLSLHDALPISAEARAPRDADQVPDRRHARSLARGARRTRALLEDDRDLRERSEEHTSELQSRLHLVCRLLLEKKKKAHISHHAQSEART